MKRTICSEFFKTRFSALLFVMSLKRHNPPHSVDAIVLFYGSKDPEEQRAYETERKLKHIMPEQAKKLPFCVSYIIDHDDWF